MINIGIENNTDTATTNSIDQADKNFDRLLMAPRSCQSRIAVPILGCVTIQSCTFREDFPNENAASKKNGTVGSRGRNIPTIPANRQKDPRENQKTFI